MYKNEGRCYSSAMGEKSAGWDLASEKISLRTLCSGAAGDRELGGAAPVRVVPADAAD